MSNWLSDSIRDIDIGSVLGVFFDNNYYELLFPFLLAFAVLYTILERINLFRSKKTGEPYKPVVFVVSLIVSLFGVSFELSPGHSVGNFMMMLFPNISALTIGILGLYIVGSIFAKDFFSGLFDKTPSSYIFMAVGVIGLGSIIFYAGIVMGFWDHLAISNQNNWNVILAVAFFILGVVFLFADLVPFGLLLLFVVGSFIWNGGELDGSGSILETFIDPVIFMLTIIVLLIQWVSGDNLATEERKLKKMEESFKKHYGHLPNSASDKDYVSKIEPYENRIYDIMEPGLRKQMEKVERLREKGNRR
jgi:hypothetical protein